MKIIKLGHCCLVIEVGGLRILTDPGSYSTAQNEVSGIDLVLITHEHWDHYHVPSLKSILTNNPAAKIITNTSVSQLLSAEAIPAEIVSNRQKATVGGVIIEGIGERHAPIYETMPPVENTGYMIANTLFYPGDAFTNPNRPIEVLALPVAGPWLTIGQAIDYAIEVKPRTAFPVHDGMLSFLGPVHRLPSEVLLKVGITFKALAAGEAFETF